MTQTAKPKIMFMGTPEFAAAILEELIKSGSYEISAVVTQVDKPVGRGQSLAPSPVKIVAQKYGLSVFTPKSVKNIAVQESALFERLNTEQPVLAVVVAYGKIIPAELLNLPKFGFINVHTSLLPRWRGAAPIHRALFAGDAKTGVSIMRMDEGLDTGPVYKTEEVAIGDNDNLQELHDKLLSVSNKVLQETIPLILTGKLAPTPQSAEGVTYADKWDKGDFDINWNEPAEVTLRRIRVCSSTTGAKAVVDGQSIKIFDAHLVKDNSFKIPAGNGSCQGGSPPAGGLGGAIVELNKNELIISTGDSESGKFIAIDKLQFPGKNIIDIKSAINGRLFRLR